MDVERGRTYRIVVRFPWGGRVELASDRVWREPDGVIRWDPAGAPCHEPFLDAVIRETESWVLGWCGGSCDVTVVVSTGPDAPEP